MLQRGTLLFFLSLEIGPAPVAAQFGERVEVRVMNVDVEVRDRDGNPVHGLTAADFEVREGRRAREVTNFTEYRGRTPAGATPSLEARPGVPRPPLHLVIFVDQMRWTRRDHERIGRAVMNMLESQLVEGDRVRIVGWNRRVVDLMGWTDDIERARAGVARAFDLSLDSGRTGVIALDQQALKMEEAMAAETGIDAGSSSGQGAGASSLAALMENSERSVAAKARWGMLTAVLDEMAAVDGRRAMLLVTTEMGKFNGRMSGTGDSVSELGPGSWDMKPLRERFTRAANASGVQVSFLYPEIETQGSSAALDAPVTLSPASVVIDSSVLAEISERTGGQFGMWIGNIEDALPRISEGLSNFYSLGYRSDLGEGESRSISVTVRDRNLRVRVRDSVARRTESEMLEAMVIAHAFKPQISQFPVSAEVRPAPARLGRRAVRVTVRFMLDDLTFDVGAAEATGGFVVAAVAISSESGETGEPAHDTHVLRMPLKEYEGLPPGQHLTWEAEVRYAGDSDRLAIGVRDAVSELTGFIVVPLPGRE